MHLKGIEALREKLPAYAGKRILLIPLTFLVFFVIGFSFLLLLDNISRIYPDNHFLYLIEPLLPILGPAFLLGSGLYLASRIWKKRNLLLTQSKERAYQRGILYGLVGIPLLFAAVVHTYIPAALLAPPLNPATSVLSSSLLAIPGLIEYERFIRMILGFLFLTEGLLTARQALLTFGIDYMMIIYLFYPEESTLQHHRIYAVVRHPAYFGIILVTVGGVFAQCSIYSVITFFLVLIGMFCHIRFVEEKELIQRFGESYVDYRKKVPAFFVRPNKIGVFVKFILSL